MFARPEDISEREFSLELWRHLSLMARLDRREFEWDPLYSSDPENPEFAMSIGGQAFYVVGMHPNASRMARQFRHCTVVFNVHYQFEALKRSGAYFTMRDKIRERDTDLQGDTNPMMEDHGVRSEARQYDGARHPDHWRPNFTRTPASKPQCPVHAGHRR